MSRRFDAVTVAACCCDMIFAGLARLPGPGEEEYGDRFVIRAGGGTNTAMALARLGLRSAALTVVGDDLPGQLVWESMERSGLDMSLVRRVPGGATGVTAVMTLPGDRAFASYAGESFCPTSGQLEQAFREADWVHSYLYWADCADFGALSRRYGSRYSFDTGHGVAVSPARLRALLRDCSLFKCNGDEACFLTGRPDAESALRSLADVCPRVVVTLGAEGAIACAEGKTCRAPGLPVRPVVDTTGAGDAFMAGYLAKAIQNRPVEECLRYGLAAGAVCVGYLGGVDDSLSPEALERLLQA